MRLYSTTTSERASKGQGGNTFLKIDIRSKDENEQEHGELKIEVFPNIEGDYILKVLRSANDRELIHEHKIESVKCLEKDNHWYNYKN